MKRKVILATAAMLVLGTVGVLEANEPSTKFIITVNAGSGGATDVNFTIPTRPGLTYDYTVDCNSDGIVEATGVTGDYTCDYGKTMYNTITIDGIFPAIYFNDTGDKDEILSVENWGTGVWSTMESAFKGTSNLVINATDVPVLYAVDNMDDMFNGATSLTGDLSNWDVSSIKSMERMFRNTNDFNSDLSGWDVSNVSSMASMFENADSFSAKIGGWDVSYVDNMNRMFAAADSFNQFLGSWDVSNVSDMERMFMGAIAFNGDISDWNVSNVANMEAMFNNTQAFNQDIGDWDVSKVTTMKFMFLSADAFTQDLGDWNFATVTDFLSMVLNTPLTSADYDNLLIGLSRTVTENNVTFKATSSVYCQEEGLNARQSLIDDHNWSITDGGRECIYFINSPYDMEVESGKQTVGTVTAYNGGGTVNTFTIVGGRDSTFFDINSSTGILTFKVAPDFAMPADGNHDNIYRVRVKATETSGEVAFKTLRVHVNQAQSKSLISVITYILF